MFSHSKQGYGFLFFTLKCYSAIAWLGDYSTNFATKKTLFFDWSKDFCGCDVSRFLHSALWKFLHLCIFTYFTCDVILYCFTCNFWNRPKGQKSVRQQLQNTWEVFQRSPSSATTVRPDWAVVKTIWLLFIPKSGHTAITPHWLSQTIQICVWFKRTTYLQR